MVAFSLVAFPIIWSWWAWRDPVASFIYSAPENGSQAPFQPPSDDIKTKPTCTRPVKNCLSDVRDPLLALNNRLPTTIVIATMSTASRCTRSTPCGYAFACTHHPRPLSAAVSMRSARPVVGVSQSILDQGSPHDQHLYWVFDNYYLPAHTSPAQLQGCSTSKQHAHTSELMITTCMYAIFNWWGVDRMGLQLETYI